MLLVYCTAIKVLAWLGETAGDSDRFVSHARSVHDQGETLQVIHYHLSVPLPLTRTLNFWRISVAFFK